MNPDQPNLSQPETPPPEKKPFFLKRKAVLIALIAIVLLLAGVLLYFFIFAQPKDTTKTNSQATDSLPTTTPTSGTIYAYSDGQLLAINPDSKEFVIAENKIDAESGSTNAGSTIPLTAPDFQSGAYVKDNAGWLITATDTKNFYSIPDTAKKTGFYSIFLSAWSSDATKLAFTVEFRCPPEGNNTCKDSDEDKTITGVYVYDKNTNKVARVQATNVIGWIPKTTKIAYFDDTLEPHQLSINDTALGTTTKSGSLDFGFAPQLSFSDDGTKMIWTAGVHGTESAATYSANLDGSNQKTLLTASFADLQWPIFLPGSESDYAYSKRKEIKCYEGTSGCVSESLNIVKNGQDKKAVEDIDSKLIGYYNNQAVVVISDGQNGLSPNNPAPYKAGVYLVDLNTFMTTKIYEKTVQKGTTSDMQINLRIGR